MTTNNRMSADTASTDFYATEAQLRAVHEKALAKLDAQLREYYGEEHGLDAKEREMLTTEPTQQLITLMEKEA